MGTRPEDDDGQLNWLHSNWMVTELAAGDPFHCCGSRRMRYGGRHVDSSSFVPKLERAGVNG